MVRAQTLILPAQSCTNEPKCFNHVFNGGPTSHRLSFAGLQAYVCCQFFCEIFVISKICCGTKLQFSEYIQAYGFIINGAAIYLVLNFFSLSESRKQIDYLILVSLHGGRECMIQLLRPTVLFRCLQSYLLPSRVLFLMQTRPFKARY